MDKRVYIEELRLLGEEVQKLEEKNCPTDASKWSYYKSQAKKKFDVYPSAYANGWASKQYKAAGGGWKQCAGESVEESVNEGKHDDMLDKLADIVKASKSFMDIGKELKKNGIKYSFGTSPLPMYIIDKPVKIAILNNKYADGAERVVGTTAIGLMESITEGAKFKITNTISKKEWAKTHKDYKSVIDGVPYVMKLTDKGTALVPVKIVESVTEGKKVFKVNPQIGKAKYSISSHDGVKKHKDGSDFFDIETFKNKVDLEKAIKNYTSKGFKMESVNEEKYPIAVEKFNQELIKHPMVKKAAQHYKKSPADIVKVLQQRLYTKGDRSGNTKEVYIDFKDTTSGITIKHKMKFNESVESVNEAYIVTYTKKKGEKPASAAFQLRGSALSFERDLKKDGYITMVTQKKVKGIDESINEAASRTAMEIGGLTGMNKDAIQKFVDDNNLDIEKVYQYVKVGKLPERMALVSAIAGKPGNSVQVKLIKKFK